MQWNSYNSASMPWYSYGVAWTNKQKKTLWKLWITKDTAQSNILSSWILQHINDSSSTTYRVYSLPMLYFVKSVIL